MCRWRWALQPGTTQPPSRCSTTTRRRVHDAPASSEADAAVGMREPAAHLRVAAQLVADRGGEAGAEMAVAGPIVFEMDVDEVSIRRRSPLTSGRVGDIQPVTTQPQQGVDVADARGRSGGIAVAAVAVVVFAVAGSVDRRLDERTTLRTQRDVQLPTTRARQGHSGPTPSAPSQRAARNPGWHQRQGRQRTDRRQPGRRVVCRRRDGRRRRPAAGTTGLAAGGRSSTRRTTPHHDRGTDPPRPERSPRRDPLTPPRQRTSPAPPATRPTPVPSPPAASHARATPRSATPPTAPTNGTRTDATDREHRPRRRARPDERSPPPSPPPIHRPVDRCP